MESLTSSGIPLESPPAPISCIETIGLFSSKFIQQLITSWARLCISGLARCTEAKSRSSLCSPLSMLEDAPPPSPISIAGPPRTISLSPAEINPFST